MKLSFKSTTLLPALVLAAAIPVAAAAQPEQHGMAARGGDHGMQRMAGMWQKTLSAGQQRRIEKMRLQTAREKSILKAKIRLAKTELALLVTDNSPDQNAINKKLNELMKLMRKKMELHYIHIIKVREILNKEQRVSFDLGVLHKAGRGHGKHH